MRALTSALALDPQVVGLLHDYFQPGVRWPHPRTPEAQRAWASLASHVPQNLAALPAG